MYLVLDHIYAFDSVRVGLLHVRCGNDVGEEASLAVRSASRTRSATRSNWAVIFFFRPAHRIASFAMASIPDASQGRSSSSEQTRATNPASLLTFGSVLGICGIKVGLDFENPAKILVVPVQEVVDLRIPDHDHLDLDGHLSPVSEPW